MKYQSALPFFDPKDIDEILIKYKQILSGNGMLTKGPIVKEFENSYSSFVGAKFGISTNSCTSALEIVLKAIKIKTNDEVIVPTQTFVSTGSSVVNAGGSVVFCDTDENFSIDFKDLKSKISDKTKAVIIVHFAGLIQKNILKIKRFLKQKNIYLIEDCAHSSGARLDNLMAGNIGDFGCHSFFFFFIMTTGEGGMITTNDEKNYFNCSSIRSIGINVKSKVEIFNKIGSNYRMTELQAILGLSQLKRLDEFVDHRIKIANSYLKELKDLSEDGVLSFQNFNRNTRHSYWKFIVFLNSNNILIEDLKQKLFENGVNISAPYNPLMHLQPVFDNDIVLPNAESLSKKHFCLPMHFKISIDDSKKICNFLKDALR